MVLHTILKTYDLSFEATKNSLCQFRMLLLDFVQKENAKTITT
jgi:hypothetical protein